MVISLRIIFAAIVSLLHRHIFVFVFIILKLLVKDAFLEQVIMLLIVPIFLYKDNLLGSSHGVLFLKIVIWK